MNPIMNPSLNLKKTQKINQKKYQNPNQNQKKKKIMNLDQKNQIQTNIRNTILKMNRKKDQIKRDYRVILRKI
jgi:hypothetical protein